MHAFILAGGFATRLWPLTEKRAKPLLPLAGKPLLSWIVEGIPKDISITVSTNAVFRVGFEKWKEDFGRDDIEILIEDTVRDDHKLGALGAVAQWITTEKINDDVLLLTGDNYFGFALSDFLAAYTENPILAAHDIRDPERAKNFGIVVTAPTPTPSPEEGERGGGRVTEFQEKPKDPKTTLVSTGCSVLPSKTLGVLTEFAKSHPDNVGGIFEELLRREIPVECFTFAEPWFDIGSFDAYLAATQELVGEGIHTEEGASLVETSANGSVVIGVGSRVRGSRLTNVVLFENCVVEDCTLEGCILDNGCHLSGVDLSGKMLREGTKLHLKN